MILLYILITCNIPWRSEFAQGEIFFQNLGPGKPRDPTGHPHQHLHPSLLEKGVGHPLGHIDLAVPKRRAGENMEELDFIGFPYEKNNYTKIIKYPFHWSRIWFHFILKPGSKKRPPWLSPPSQGLFQESESAKGKLRQRQAQGNEANPHNNQEGRQIETTTWRGPGRTW